MRAPEFKVACQMAFSSEDLLFEDTDSFIGFGLRSFKPIMATMRQVAAAIRYQSFLFNGGIDNDALNECRNAFRTKVTIIG